MLGRAPDAAGESFLLAPISLAPIALGPIRLLTCFNYLCALTVRILNRDVDRSLPPRYVVGRGEHTGKLFVCDVTRVM